MKLSKSSPFDFTVAWAFRRWHLSKKAMAGTTMLLLATAFLAGCHASDKPQTEDDFFTPKLDTMQVQAFSDAQASAAAQNEASLYKTDFTGPHLNSLGEHELEMISSTHLHPDLTQIYLVDSADSIERRQAVNHYLLSHGWKADQFALVAGANPNSLSPAKPKIDDLDKLSNAAPAQDSGMGGANASAGIVGH